MTQLNDNLMTLFNERKKYQGTRTIKTLKFTSIRSGVNFCNHLEKRKAICHTNNRGNLPKKVTPDVDFTGKPQ